ncbi:GntR family transcriptional regulator [Corynebacterium kutscheri]|uniref:GntR family transcriptional regulator n=1 Tax=Corynebacterium kutscheri TaxID=35755 RepID=A0AB38VRK8_9CORY|nr:GntR family transcriptional regulator [Corynebacterium kutscheri]
MAPRKATAAAKAFDGIVDYIRVKRLNPGDLLPAEQELCEIIGCSRSSIREAMRTLASLDIVEVRHGHGTYVSKMSLDPLIQGLILRVLLSTDSSLTALLDIVDLRAAIDHSLAEELAEAWKSRDITPSLTWSTTCANTTNAKKASHSTTAPSTKPCSPPSKILSQKNFPTPSGKST